MDLELALRQFDRTSANIDLLFELWSRYEALIPQGIEFGLDTSEVDRLRLDFDEAVGALPAIDGYTVHASLVRLDDIAESRADAAFASLGPGTERGLWEEVERPRRELDQYRQLFRRKRRSLVRSHVDRVVSEIDAILSRTIAFDGGRKFENPSLWLELGERLAEFDRLVGSELPTGTRRSDLARHMHFAQSGDLYDIVEFDWPDVRGSALDLVFEGEPMPVAVSDLGDLVDAKPSGAVSSALDWSQLDSEQFERLILEVLRSADQYENAEWLMHPNAPDRARDISADRVDIDELSGTRRTHVLVQCKHWTSKSVSVDDVNGVLSKAGLWSKPFRTVVVATSGTFTQDAVEFREKRELADESPRLEFWPRSHVEYLLTSRTAVRAAFFS